MSNTAEAWDDTTEPDLCADCGSVAHGLHERCPAPRRGCAECGGPPGACFACDEPEGRRS